MGEIKSAIELAMERTKGLVMDEREKEQSLIQDAENRIRALVRRFLDDAIDFGEFRNQYDKIELKENAKQTLLVDIVVDGFDVGGDARSFDLLRVAERKLDSRLIAELDGFQRDFSKALEKNRAEVRKRILKRLKGVGISGSALEPNLESWDEWSDAAAETKQAFGSRLARWKEKVKAVTV